MRRWVWIFVTVVLLMGCEETANKAASTSNGGGPGGGSSSSSTGKPSAATPPPKTAPRLSFDDELKAALDNAPRTVKLSEFVASPVMKDFRRYYGYTLDEGVTVANYVEQYIGVLKAIRNGKWTATESRTVKRWLDYTTVGGAMGSHKVSAERTGYFIGKTAAMLHRFRPSEYAALNVVAHEIPSSGSGYPSFKRIALSKALEQMKKVWDKNFQPDGFPNFSYAPYAEAFYASEALVEAKLIPEDVLRYEDVWLRRPSRLGDYVSSATAVLALVQYRRALEMAYLRGENIENLSVDSKALAFLEFYSNKGLKVNEPVGAEIVGLLELHGKFLK